MLQIEHQPTLEFMLQLGKGWNKNNIDTKAADIWYQKVEGKKQRNKEVNAYLLKTSWKDLTFWGKDIDQDLVSYLSENEAAIHDQKNKINS